MIILEESAGFLHVAMRGCPQDPEQEINSKLAREVGKEQLIMEYLSSDG